MVERAHNDLFRMRATIDPAGGAPSRWLILSHQKKVPSVNPVVSGQRTNMWPKKLLIEMPSSDVCNNGTPRTRQRPRRGPHRPAPRKSAAAKPTKFRSGCCASRHTRQKATPREWQPRTRWCGRGWDEAPSFPLQAGRRFAAGSSSEAFADGKALSCCDLVVAVVTLVQRAGRVSPPLFGHRRFCPRLGATKDGAHDACYREVDGPKRSKQKQGVEWIGEFYWRPEVQIRENDKTGQRNQRRNAPSANPR
jgi:hypothetical protein